MKVPLSGGNATRLAGGHPRSIAINATSLYWTDSLAGEVRKLRLDGGSPSTLASGECAATALSVDATSVYWVGCANHIRRTSLDGGDVSSVASGGTGTVSNLVVDPTSVYWILNNRQIMKASLGDGVVTTLAAEVTSGAGSLSLVDSNLYWRFTDASMLGNSTLPGTAAIRSLSVEGGSPKTVLSKTYSYDRDGGAVDSGRGIWAVAADSRGIYYYMVEDGRLLRMPLGGGPPTTLVSSQPRVNSIFLGPNDLCWPITGDLFTAPIGGGSPRLLARGLSSGVVLDATNAYFGVEETDPEILGTCRQGACECPGGSICYGECVDTSSASDHCGNCDTRCAPDTVCRAGVCG